MKSRVEVATQWSIDDLLDANMALDVWDDIESKTYEKAERDAETRRARA